MVRKFRNFSQIVHYPRHNLSGSDFVKIAKGQRLKMRKDILPHVVFHSYPHNMTPIVDHIVENGSQNKEQRHNYCDNDNPSHIPGRYIVIER